VNVETGLSVETSAIGGVTVLAVHGEVDAATAPFLQEHVLNAANAGRLLLDLSHVSFMSSAGLRVLLLLHRSIAARGGRVLLVGLADTLRETMGATGFLRFFSTAHSVESGLSQL
jgi:anti-sigma B factor antagonist